MGDDDPLDWAPDAIIRPTAAAEAVTRLMAERDALREQLDRLRAAKCWKCGTKPRGDGHGD